MVHTPLAQAALGTVIVTGGSSGLGAAVVAAVTKAGGRPAVIDVNPPEDADVAHVVADVADRLETRGVDPLSSRHDLGERAAEHGRGS